MRSNIAASKRHAAPWNVPLFLILTLLALQFSRASATQTLPIKHTNEANKQIHWPDDIDPSKADAFVHNEIFIKASANVIWENLVNATDWPSWYSNSADIKIEGSESGRLQAGSVFTWKTFGFPINSRINEFVNESRIGWYGEGTGIKAYHTWLILKKEDGCEVVTEESQIGPSAIKFNTEQPTAMFDGHHWWLTALKARCERAKQLSESISPAHLRLNLSSARKGQLKEPCARL